MTNAIGAAALSAAAASENNENELPGFKLQDYKSKLEMMKAKYGIQNSSANVSSRLSDLKAKVNSLLAPSGIPTSTTSTSALKAKLEKLKK
jgi:hypothetical protein